MQHPGRRLAWIRSRSCPHRHMPVKIHDFTSNKTMRPADAMKNFALLSQTRTRVGAFVPGFLRGTCTSVRHRSVGEADHLSRERLLQRGTTELLWDTGTKLTLGS